MLQGVFYQNFHDCAIGHLPIYTRKRTLFHVPIFTTAHFLTVIILHISARRRHNRINLAPIHTAQGGGSFIVGYTGATTGADNNFVTIPFNAIGFNTSDIQQIKISDGGAGGIGWGGERFAIWEGLPTVVAGSGFVYYDPSMDAAGKATDYFWGDGEGNKATFPIAPGQGVVVNCAADLTIQIDPPYSL